jgi:hypothetical protein
MASMRAARAALAAGVLALALTTGEPAGAQREIRVPVRPVVMSEVELPSTHTFGDRVRAALSVAVNPLLADPASVRADARFPPYRVVDVAGPAREARGGHVVVRYEYLLECLESTCLPSEDATEFPEARVEYRASGGADSDPLTVEWPELAVVSRLSERDLEQPALRASAPAEREGGNRLAAWALPAAAVLVLAGGIVAAWLLWRAAPRAAPPAVRRLGPSPVEAALVILERPAAPPADERRIALDALARSLEKSGRGDLAARARHLAWFEGPPPPPAVDDLVADVRREVA